MSVTETILSFAAGSATGFLYWLSFSTGTQTLFTRTTHAWFPLKLIGRIGLFGITLYALLLTGTINFILFVTIFFLTFWLLLLNLKV